MQEFALDSLTEHLVTPVVEKHHEEFCVQTISLSSLPVVLRCIVTAGKNAKFMDVPCVLKVCRGLHVGNRLSFQNCLFLMEQDEELLSRFQQGVCHVFRRMTQRGAGLSATATTNVLLLRLQETPTSTFFWILTEQVLRTSATRIGCSPLLRLWDTVRLQIGVSGAVLTPFFCCKGVPQRLHLIVTAV